MHKYTHILIARLVARLVPALPKDELEEWSTAPDRHDEFPGMFPSRHHEHGGQEYRVAQGLVEARRLYLTGSSNEMAQELGIAFHWIADDACPSAAGDATEHNEFESECAGLAQGVVLRFRASMLPLYNKEEARNLVATRFEAIRSEEVNSPLKAVKFACEVSLAIAQVTTQSETSPELEEQRQQVSVGVIEVEKEAYRRKLEIEKLLGTGIVSRIRRWWRRRGVERWANQESGELIAGYTRRAEEARGWFNSQALPNVTEMRRWARTTILEMGRTTT